MTGAAPVVRGPIVHGRDDQRDHDVDVARWVALAEGALRTERAPDGAELTLLFVDEAVIAELNETHLGGDGPTDVLAFPIDDAPGDLIDGVPVLLGDVVLCPTVAARQATGPVEDELALLVVHGILHVLGHDHAEPAERAVMRARERALLDALHQPA